jgi:hypothetical protein
MAAQQLPLRSQDEEEGRGRGAPHNQHADAAVLGHWLTKKFFVAATPVLGTRKGELAETEAHRRVSRRRAARALGLAGGHHGGGDGTRVEVGAGGWVRQLSRPVDEER